MFYTSGLTIKIDEKLDPNYDNNYIKKIYKLQNYVKKNSSNINSLFKKEGWMELDIYLEFLDNKTIRLGDFGPTVNEFQDKHFLTTSDLEKINVSLEDYKEKLQK